MSMTLSCGPAWDQVRRAMRKRSNAAEETALMHYTTAQGPGQARLADLHRKARLDALARAARRARRHHATYRAPALLAALTRRARRPGPPPKSLQKLSPRCRFAGASFVSTAEDGHGFVPGPAPQLPKEA